MSESADTRIATRAADHVVKSPRLTLLAQLAATVASGLNGSADLTHSVESKGIGPDPMLTRNETIAARAVDIATCILLEVARATGPISEEPKR